MFLTMFSTFGKKNRSDANEWKSWVREETLERAHWCPSDLISRVRVITDTADMQGCTHVVAIA